MFDRRYDITGELELLSPLHIGTGERISIPRPGSNMDEMTVAPIVRDCDGKPFIPSTTMKGLLRRLGEGFLDADRIEILFGAIKDSTADKGREGRMGALLARGAALIGAVPNTTGYPYAAEAAAARGAGTFIAAHTALDAMTGATFGTKLFFKEMMPAGAKFELRLTLLAERGDTARLADLLGVLARLEVEEGVPCGGGKGDGSGALQLHWKTLSVKDLQIGADGKLSCARSHPTKPEHRRTIKRWRGKLHCEGPFLSVDSSHAPKPFEKGGEGDHEPQLKYQQSGKGQPLALGSQVMGALRAQARWLEGLQLLRAGTGAHDIANLVDAGAWHSDPAQGNERAVAKTVRDKGQLKPGKGGAPAKVQLSKVERLFGVTGFAGLLELEKMAFSQASEFDISSVKLDHFSGAPIDKALFKTRAVTGTQLELALVLRSRGGIGAATTADKTFCEDLVQDIANNGLALGHAWGKGFGWFDFKEGGWDA